MCPKARRASLLQTAEYLAMGAIALGVLYLSKRYVGLDIDLEGSDFVKIFIAGLFGGVAKYARASPGVPVPDYVNEPPKAFND